MLRDICDDFPFLALLHTFVYHRYISFFLSFLLFSQCREIHPCLTVRAGTAPHTHTHTLSLALSDLSGVFFRLISSSNDGYDNQKYSILFTYEIYYIFACI